MNKMKTISKCGFAPVLFLTTRTYMSQKTAFATDIEADGKEWNMTLNIPERLK